MAGCITKCTTYRTDSIYNAWSDIRNHFGPRVAIGSSIYNNDISEWTEWATSKGISILDVDKFGKWLIWKCSYGTTNCGNLATRVRDHEGIKGVPCPFDSNNYDVGRSETWLGYMPISTVAHGNYYMKVANREGVYGFECTYSSCPYLIDNGRPYFHV